MNVLQYDLKGSFIICRFYPGVTDALRFSSSKIFIVTTKQVSSAMLRHQMKTPNLFSAGRERLRNANLEGAYYTIYFSCIVGYYT